MADVVITFGAEDSAYQRVVKRASDAAKGFAQAMGSIVEPSKRAQRATRDMTEEEKRLNQALREGEERTVAYKDALGVLGGRYGEMAERAQRFLFLQDRGAKMLAVGGIAALSAAAAVGTLAANWNDAVRNIDDLSAALSTHRQQELRPHILALQEARNATRAWDSEWTTLRLNLANSEGVFTNLQRAATGFLSVLNDNLPSGNGLSDLAFGYGGPLAFLQPLIQRGRAQEENILGTGDLGVAADGRPNALIGPEDTTGSGVRVTAADRATMERQAAEAAKAAQAERVRAAEQATAQLLGLYEQSTAAALEGEDAIRFALSLRIAQIDELEAVSRDHGLAEAARVAAAEEASLRIMELREKESQQIARIRDEESRAAVAAAAEQESLIDQQIVGTIAVSQSALGAFQRIADEQARSGKEGAREAWAISKALGLAQTIVGGAVGVVNAFQLGPVAGAIAAAAIAATVAAEIATIASTNPSFHIGGILAPDEAMYGGARVRTNEETAILTAQSRSVPERDSLLRDLNAGLQPGQPTNVVVILDDLPRRTRLFASNDGRAGFGRAARST